MTPEECEFHGDSLTPICPKGTSPTSHPNGNYWPPCYCYPDNMKCEEYGLYSEHICCKKNETVASNNYEATCCPKNTTPCANDDFVFCCQSNETCISGSYSTKHNDKGKDKK